MILFPILLCLISSNTCPTCRADTQSRSLIKLFFTDDDNRANLSLDDILKTNDELTKSLREEREKVCEQESELTESRIEVRKLKEKLKSSEREMANLKANIEGLKDLNKDLTAKVIADKSIIKNLKFDLLAERQIRRINQDKLREAYPGDQDYNIETVDEGLVTTTATNSEGTSSPASASQTEVLSPLLNLRCEIEMSRGRDKSGDEGETSTHRYILPSKMIRGSKPDYKAATGRFFQRNGKPLVKKSTFIKTAADKPVGFSFTSALENFSPSSSPQPSTSTAGSTSQSTNNDIFGNIFANGGGEASFKDFRQFSSTNSTNNRSPINNFFSNPSQPSQNSFIFQTYRQTSDTENVPKTSYPQMFSSLNNNTGTSRKFFGPKASER